MKFGLACEGVTDQITLENILCGYFEDPDLDEDIGALQPLFDETDKKQRDYGGWENLIAYLQSSRFRDDVLNTKYVVLQIDSDISEHQNFGVSHRDNGNQILAPDKLIEDIIIKLISVINLGEQGFYEEHENKFVFAVSVHSLECWLYAFYNTKALRTPKIAGCYKALEYLSRQQVICKKQQLEKTYRCYQKLSQVFLKRKNIDTVTQKDPSLKCFIQALEKLE